MDIFYRLGQLNITDNYFLRARALRREDSVTPEGEEDKSLIGAYVLVSSDGSLMDRGCQDRQGRLVPKERRITRNPIPPQDISEEHLTQYIRDFHTSDGAIIFDTTNHQASPYAVIDGFYDESMEKIGAVTGRTIVFFDDVIRMSVPGTFTYKEGCQIKMGSKSQNALAAAIALSEAEVDLLKYTVYNRVGTGKVVRMNYDPRTDRLEYQEMFLVFAHEVDHSIRDQVVEQAMVDPEDGVVCVYQGFETTFERDNPEIKPQLRERRIHQFWVYK